MESKIFNYISIHNYYQDQDSIDSVKKKHSI